MSARKLKDGREPCKGAARHWFSTYGNPGDVRPVCVRHGCDVPNPKWDRFKRVGHTW